MKEVRPAICPGPARGRRTPGPRHFKGAGKRGVRRSSGISSSPSCQNPLNEWGPGVHRPLAGPGQSPGLPSFLIAVILLLAGCATPSPTPASVVTRQVPCARVRQQALRAVHPRRRGGDRAARMAPVRPAGRRRSARHPPAAAARAETRAHGRAVAARGRVPGGPARTATGRKANGPASTTSTAPSFRPARTPNTLGRRPSFPTSCGSPAPAPVSLMRRRIPSTSTSPGRCRSARRGAGRSRPSGPMPMRRNWAT